MNAEIIYCYLKQHPVTAGLADDRLLKIALSVKIQSFKKGSSIYLSENFDNRIYLLLKGRVRITESDEHGEEMIKEILSDGEIFGDVSLEDGIAADEFAETITDNTIVCSFLSSDFQMMMQTDSRLAMNYAKQVSGKFRRLESRHSNLVFKDTKTRLVGFFRDWAHREGQKNGDRIMLNNYLTHNDIAGIISTSRQSVTTLLNELKDLGFLFYNRKQIEIHERCMMN